MESEHPISSRLKQAREAKNLSIAELSKLTNVRTHILQALDDGRLEELPKVYMRSFIKRYAQSVGISTRDIEELMNRYLAVESTPSAMKSVMSAPREPKSGQKSTIAVGRSRQRKRWLSIFYVALGLAVVGGLYVMYGPSKVVAPKSSTPAPSVIVSDKDTASNVPASGGGLMTYFGANAADSVSLEATTTDTVWINITIDGKTSEQITMHPQQSKKWMAAERFLLSIGNAGGVKLKRNGIDLPQVGKIGETVRSIRISAKEFLTSASPWKSQRDSVKLKPNPSQKPGAVKPGPASSKPPLPSTVKPPMKSPATVQPAAKPGTQSNQVSPSPTLKTNSTAGSQAKPSSVTTPAKPGVSVTTKPGAPTTVTTKPPIVGASTKPNAAAKPAVTLDAKRAAAARKAALDEQAARKKRLERIRREASRNVITPVQIKP